MRILIVIGAGASYDSNPLSPRQDANVADKLPLAKDLFASFPTQNAYLQRYNLVGLAGILRSKSLENPNFNIEDELATIHSDSKLRGDKNRIQDLFATRFYLHGVINTLTNKTIDYSSSHTVYIDLLNQIKSWIDESPTSRFADLVVFNYDTLIEKAMETVYRYDWTHKSNVPLLNYYAGTNLRVYKPHGSINWGREILKDGEHLTYYSETQAIDAFEVATLSRGFQVINPNSLTSESHGKNYVPAIAIPFSDKTDFQECPDDMFKSMVDAIKGADKMITLGWKGGDNHFIKILLDNNKNLSEIHVVSPKGDTQLSEVYPETTIKKHESPLTYFVSGTTAFSELLASI